MTAFSEAENEPILDGRLLSAWIADLSHQDAEQRYEAVYCVYRIAERHPRAVLPSIPVLLAALHDPESAVRQGAVGTLGLLGADDGRIPQAVLRIGGADPDEHVRYKAAQALIALGQLPQAVQALAAVVRHPRDREWVCDALLDLGKLGPAARPAVAAVREALQDTDWHVVSSAAWTLLKLIGAEAVPILLEATSDPSPVVRAELIQVLGACKHSDAEVFQAIDKCLERDSEPRVREVAARALAEYGWQTKQEFPGLRQAINDSDALVRVEAAASLIRLNRQYSEAISELARALQASDPEVRNTAVWKLSKVAPANASHLIPDLIVLLREREPTSKNAALALARIGPTAVPAVTELLRRDDLDSHLGALLALEYLGSDARAAVVDLLRVFDQMHVYRESTEPHVWAAIEGCAYCALGTIVGPENESAVPYLIQGIKVEDTADVTKIAMLNGLARIGPKAKSALPALKVLLHDAQLEVRRAAANAIKSIEMSKK
jgi:HEAT repeat protein